MKAIEKEEIHEHIEKIRADMYDPSEKVQTKTKTKTKKHKKKTIVIRICIVILILLLCQLGLSTMQHTRYHYQDEGYDDYCCVQMSRDCEIFFESMGIHVYQMEGARDTDEKSAAGIYKRDCHRWILLDFGWIQIHYECTDLCPWNPMWNGFENVLMCEGYVVDGRHFDDEMDLRWWDYE